MVGGELDVGATDGLKPGDRYRVALVRGRPLHSPSHALRELSEAIRGDGGHEDRLVVEVSVRGVCRDTDIARGFAQAERARPAGLNETCCRCNKGVAKVAVVVGIA